ncbi:MAG: phosphoribosyltransferase [Kiritimatiellae bacterium]|nr:phosphoribosyltransferase [Verrucomicrobiota bacterium]MBU4285406.1 phosphoribosyltransferase [Verrucomicrobiota bacterium]MBU4365759.1 phosphoribosyltransferase [Verrucomicrobiota bacterium]MCG2660585.1 phosphoribosyltransferase [Kiritimatiellia bacterium]
MKYRNVSWREIDTCVETVGQAIRAARFRPDCIVAILKGGLVPARLLSDFFGSIEIYPIRVKAYAGTRKLARVRFEPFRYSIGRKNVLLVDDIHDSGQTLQKVIRHLQCRRPRALHTATLFYKHNALHPPYFHARTVAPDVWVVFPWERNEMKNAHHTNRL